MQQTPVRRSPKIISSFLLLDLLESIQHLKGWLEWSQFTGGWGGGANIEAKLALSLSLSLSLSLMTLKWLLLWLWLLHIKLYIRHVLISGCAQQPTLSQRPLWRGSAQSPLQLFINCTNGSLQSSPRDVDLLSKCWTELRSGCSLLL